MASIYSVTITQDLDLATAPDPEGGENYTLETTFSAPEIDGAPAVGAFDGYFILVKKEATEPEDTYEKICVYADVIQYGTDRTAALVYYRKLTWIKTFETTEEAEAAALLQTQRTQYLCDDFATYDEGPWPDTTVTVVTST